jgi:hypothetical protein
MQQLTLAAGDGSIPAHGTGRPRPSPSGLDRPAGPRYKQSMSEEKIDEVVNEALAAAGIEDTVTAAGEFNPRGHSGAGFACWS